MFAACFLLKAPIFITLTQKNFRQLPYCCHKDAESSASSEQARVVIQGRLFTFINPISPTRVIALLFGCAALRWARSESL